MTYLIRYVDPITDKGRVGVEDADGDLRALGAGDMSDLLALPVTEIRQLVEGAQGAVLHATRLPPVDGRTEVWAAGVTYERSRDARVEESDAADVYTLVYGAERPELFLKSVAWRVCTDDEAIGIRADSPLNVPEPELAVVVNAHSEVVGYTICNDVSSRSLEGTNPLYLPQAKIYAGACALHHRVRPAWEVADPHHLEISCEVWRDRAVVWSGATNTSTMRRTIPDLVSWTARADRFPQGFILSTGTGIVPDLDFSLSAGDAVSITIEAIGTLSNTVRTGVEPFEHLTRHHGGRTRR